MVVNSKCGMWISVKPDVSVHHEGEATTGDSEVIRASILMVETQGDINEPTGIKW